MTDAPQNLDYAAQGEVETNKDARLMGMLCHLLAIFTGFIGPIIIWAIKKNEMPFVNDQGKESLNFVITLLIAYVISYLLVFVVIGIILVPAVAIAGLVFMIIASIKANQGIYYRYPFAIRLIK